MRLKVENGSKLKPGRRQSRSWDDADHHALALGCSDCADLAVCGGLHQEQDTFSCLDECCGKPDSCAAACPRNLVGFRTSMREIDGFSLATIPRTAPSPAPAIDKYAPVLYHANRRAGLAAIDTVALPLYGLFNANGAPRFPNSEVLRRAFGVAPGVRVLLMGSGRDKSIERWWGWSDARRKAIASLHDVDIALATSPNFSLFTDQLRYDDLFNIKRICTAWQEFVTEKVPCALHVNARTERDYERYAQFIREREEVSELAFEFGTGAGWAQRRPFHARHLAEISQFVGRPLRLVMIGGGPILSYLSTAFAQVTYVDTTPFMKALHRRRLVRDGLELTEGSALSVPGAPVDALLAENISASRAHYVALMPARSPNSEQTPESLGSAASAPVAAA